MRALHVACLDSDTARPLTNTWPNLTGFLSIESDTTH